MRYPRTVEGCTIKNTRAKGYGIFAEKNYKPGDVIGKTIGIKVKGIDPRLTHRGVQIGRDLFIEPKRFSLIWYLNHTCDPNAYVNQGVLVARKKITQGDEITADYSLFTDFPTWDMDCACNTKNCRKIVLPFHKLGKKPKEFVTAYLK
jgi:SET domain-containing protein